MIIYLPLAVAVIGLLIYAMSEKAKPQEIGRIMLFCGLLAWLIAIAGHTISLLPK